MKIVQLRSKNKRILMFWLFGLFLCTLQHYLEHQLTASEKKCGFVVKFELIGDINLRNSVA